MFDSRYVFYAMKMERSFKFVDIQELVRMLDINVIVFLNLIFRTYFECMVIFPLV